MTLGDWRPVIRNNTSKLIGVFLFAVLLAGIWGTTNAQQHGKIARVGYLSLRGASSQAASVEAFRQSLRELGYEKTSYLSTDLVEKKGTLLKIWQPSWCA